MKSFNHKNPVQNNKNMSEWKKYILEEITEPVKETYNPDGSCDLSYIGLEHIEPETLRLNSIGLSSDVTSNKFKFKPNDILFGKLRPYFRKVVQPKFAGICSTDIWVFRAKENFDQKFLFYFLANWDFVNTANHGESGTRMPRADWNFLKSTEWFLPPLPEQKAIAEVLSSLDDKIDLLHRQNKTLEQLAETLFRQWFVEEAEESWEEITFGDIVKPRKGKNLTKSEAIEGEFPVVAGGLEPSCYHNEANTKAPVITVSASGANAGFVRLYHTPVWSSDSSYIDETITPYVFFSYVFLKVNQRQLTDKQEGSAQPHIYPSHIMELDCLNYPKELIEKFEKEVTPMFTKIKSNTQQIRTLTQLRDTLLPKLMSGEVRVSEK